MDGSGYPRRSKDEQIPFLRRASSPSWMYGMRSQVIVLIARVGAKRKLLEFIKEQSGKHFDPQVVESLP